MAQEQIVLVDADGGPIGAADKLASHHAETPLHLAFSCYVFNRQGEFLVTRRAHGKKVWPDVWTNSCCGHPAPGEAMEDAITRRLDYELGMKAEDIRVLAPRYRYTTPPYNGIIENEFCPVYIARATSSVVPNPEEVDDYRWMSWDDYVAQSQADKNDVWSWWCKDQLEHIRDDPFIRQYSRPV